MVDQTHYIGCWEDPRHHACALREIERLRELLREALSPQIYSHVVPHYQNWEQRVREALGND
jgi:hypothetical protein